MKGVEMADWQSDILTIIDMCFDSWNMLEPAYTEVFNRSKRSVKISLGLGVDLGAYKSW